MVEFNFVLPRLFCIHCYSRDGEFIVVIKILESFLINHENQVYSVLLNW